MLQLPLSSGEKQVKICHLTTLGAFLRLSFLSWDGSFAARNGNHNKAIKKKTETEQNTNDN